MEEGTLTEKMALSDWLVGKPEVHCERLPPLAGGTECTRKQAEWGTRGKPVRSASPCPPHQFLPLGSCLEYVSSLPPVMDCEVEQLK